MKKPAKIILFSSFILFSGVALVGCATPTIDASSIFGVTLSSSFVEVKVNESVEIDVSGENISSLTYASENSLVSVSLSDGKISITGINEGVDRVRIFYEGFNDNYKTILVNVVNSSSNSHYELEINDTSKLIYDVGDYFYYSQIYVSLNEYDVDNNLIAGFELNPEADIESPNLCTYGRASYDFMYQKGEDRIDAHTFIHETGHLLGLNDYYDYSNTRSPLGLYDMQDCNVGDHNVWTKTALGWIDPIIIDTSENIPAKVHLNPRENGGAIFITNDYSGSVFDEYLVLELYTPNGLNELDSTIAYNSYYGRMPQESGVKLYHVDARLIDNVQGGRQVYYDSSSLAEGIPDHYVTIGASNTYSYDRNYTVELFEQIELVSSDPNGGSYQRRFGPYSSSDLFQTGDTFDMDTYKSFTYRNSGNLNSGDSLDIEIYFTNVSEEGADLVIVPLDE